MDSAWFWGSDLWYLVESFRSSRTSASSYSFASHWSFCSFESWPLPQHPWTSFRTAARGVPYSTLGACCANMPAIPHFSTLSVEPRPTDIA